MKNETPEKIDEIWHEQITSRETPTEDETAKEVLEQLYDEIRNYKLPSNYPNTNYAADKKVVDLFAKNKNLDYETIAKIFNIENRAEIDLQNLKEFIVCITLMGGNDVLKAQVRGNKKQIKAEIKKHETRCELMTVLLQAIDSYLCQE